MRRFVPIVVFAVLLMAAWSAAQTSVAHRQPLSKLDCRQCHTCDYPTSDSPCLISCPRIEAVQSTAPHDAAEGPASILLDKLVDLYEPVQFNHLAHANMSGMGGDCATCHHYSPPGRIPPCSECHEASRTEDNLRMPSLKGAYHRQCIACHREWTHDTKCTACHAPRSGAIAPTDNGLSGMLGSAHPRIAAPDIKVYETPYQPAPVVTFFHQEHIDLFGLRCVDCHQKESCSNCHDVLKPAQVVAKTPEQVHAVCNDCHRQDACAKCHDNAQRPPFTHASTGWPLNRFHASLECSSCHASGQRITQLDRACTGCHGDWTQESFAHAVTGLRLDELHGEFDCEGCHSERRFDVVPTCSSCHDDERNAYDVPPGERIPGLQ
ncbi:MAG TPA: cytochrome c3 family protein [candidate division Zixibacteria bacterium]|jgi:hypothetical protein